MRGWLRWIASVASMAYGGPGFIDPHNVDLSLSPADDAAARWAVGSAVLAPLVVVILAMIGAPWPIIAVVAAILLLPLILNRTRVLRRP